VVESLVNVVSGLTLFRPPIFCKIRRNIFGETHSLAEVTLAAEEVFDLLDEDVAAHVGDGFGEGELLGAGLDAVLGEAALLNAAVSGQGAEAFFF